MTPTDERETISIPRRALEEALRYMDACRERRETLIPIGSINLIRAALGGNPNDR